MYLAYCALASVLAMIPLKNKSALLLVTFILALFFSYVTAFRSVDIVGDSDAYFSLFSRYSSGMHVINSEAFGREYLLRILAILTPADDVTIFFFIISTFNFILSAWAIYILANSTFQFSPSMSKLIVWLCFIGFWPFFLYANTLSVGVMTSLCLVSIASLCGRHYVFGFLVFCLALLENKLAVLFLPIMLGAIGVGSFFLFATFFSVLMATLWMLYGGVFFGIERKLEFYRMHFRDPKDDWIGLGIGFFSFLLLIGFSKLAYVHRGVNLLQSRLKLLFPPLFLVLIASFVSGKIASRLFIVCYPFFIFVLAYFGVRMIGSKTSTFLFLALGVFMVSFISYFDIVDVMLSDF